MRDDQPDRKATRPHLAHRGDRCLEKFILQNVLLRWFQAGASVDQFALSVAGLRAGHVWTLVTLQLPPQPGLPR